MKSLLQEIVDFKRYGDCLDNNLYEEYDNYLVEKLLNEIAVKGLVDSFRRRVFNKKEIDSLDATVNVMKSATKAMQQIEYEKAYGKIIPNGSTHLETAPEKYCTKAAFKREFVKEKFEDREDLNAEDLAEILLNLYLENFDENGWLILEKDDYESTKHAKISNLVF